MPACQPASLPAWTTGCHIHVPGFHLRRISLPALRCGILVGLCLFSALRRYSATAVMTVSRSRMPDSFDRAKPRYQESLVISVILGVYFFQRLDILDVVPRLFVPAALLPVANVRNETELIQDLGFPWCKFCNEISVPAGIVFLSQSCITSPPISMSFSHRASESRRRLRSVLLWMRLMRSVSISLTRQPSASSMIIIRPGHRFGWQEMLPAV